MTDVLEPETAPMTEVPPEVQQVLDQMKAAVLPVIQHDAAISPAVQRLDRQGLAFARVQGGGGFISGWTAAMARTLGTLGVVHEMRELRRSNRSDYYEDPDGRPPERDGSDLRLPREFLDSAPATPVAVRVTDTTITASATTAPAPLDLPLGRPIPDAASPLYVPPRYEEDDNEDDEDNHEDHYYGDDHGCRECNDAHLDDNASSCCGCCDDCEVVHTARRDYNGNGYVREVGNLYYCRSCDHTCYEDED